MPEHRLAKTRRAYEDEPSNWAKCWATAVRSTRAVLAEHEAQRVRELELLPTEPDDPDYWGV